MTIQWRDIGYFSALAEHGHVGRAAEALELGQPALSISLRRLEKAVDAILFKRTPKGIELTAEGRALLDHVRRLQLARTNMEREILDIASGKTGRLRIGVSPMTADCLADTYPLLLKDAPGLKLEITDSDNDIMLPALLNGQLDMVLNYLTPLPFEGTKQEHVYFEHWVVCASEKHPLTKQKRVTLQDLTRERWALSTVNTLPTNALPRAFSERNLPPPAVVVEARPVRIRLQAVAGSDLLTYTSKRIMREAAARFHLKEIAVRELTMRRPVGVILRKDAYIPAAVRRLVGILKSVAHELERRHA
jgi:DNA-binding transcriptional LysR family regulator